MAFSGKKREYKQVANFLYALSETIYKRYKIDSIKFAIVPGNHDVDYDLGMMSRSHLENIDKENSYNAVMASELQKQQQFYVLAQRFLFNMLKRDLERS